MGTASSKSARKAQSNPTLAKFYTIRDHYESVDEVTDALRQQGLESSNLIVGVDFTKSNEWSGKRSFFGRSLHSFDTAVPNPYEEVINIIGNSLAAFDDDKLIPTYGFGDLTTRDKYVFSFYPQDQPIYGLENVVNRYRQIAPYVDLCGPTSFAPLINRAISIVRQSGNQYHILLIIADGQISEQCMRSTVDAIVQASNFPLSIVMVGVGDGPWEVMEKFDDQLPSRRFDNFQFVNYTEQMLKARQYNYTDQKRQATFALHALMEIPEQYQLIKKLRLLEGSGQVQNQPWNSTINPALEPPPEVKQAEQQTGVGGVQLPPNAPQLNPNYGY
eukprot:TRINITY_DN2412_c0_g2_i1.p1 TRINITY_DN2412_c0_g2~~TRINITY_DN2412_c0_g2_i1.p1  ORF type:complete len:331 (-),score=37.86 TRINITY_DN2412_c0_g2_i1:1192-2184(-)